MAKRAKPKLQGVPYVLENAPETANIEAFARPVCEQMYSYCVRPDGYSSKKAMVECVGAFALLFATLLRGLDAESAAAMRKAFSYYLDGYGAAFRRVDDC